MAVLAEFIAKYRRFISGSGNSAAYGSIVAGRRPKNLIIQPELVDLGSSRKVVLMTRRLGSGLLSAGAAMIGCSGRGGRAMFVVLKEGLEFFESARPCFEEAGAEYVKIIHAGEGRGKKVQKLLQDFMPDIILLPSPVEDREAFITFSGFAVKVLKMGLPVKILAYELHSPLLPDLVVNVTHDQHLKDRFAEYDLEVDLSHSLNHYRSVTNMRGRGFAEAFVHISPETLAETERVGDVSLESLDKNSIRFFRGFERLEKGETKWWDNHEEGKRALILSPHFDDETIGCGGTICRHVCRGDEVTVLFMTDGREGDPGESDLDLVASIRKREAVDAMEVLGVERMEFLDQPETMLMPGAEVERTVGEIINRFDPDVIYLPSFLENHIDHLELNRLFYRVVKKMDHDLEIRLFGLWTLIPPNFLVDIGDDFDRKIRAINKYRSQITQVDYLSVTIAINRYWSIRYGDGEGYLETFYSVGVREYCSMIEELGVDSESFI